MQQHTKGFSLIELLVVIAIIGILSSVVMVSLNSARAKGRDAKRITDVKQLSLALALYYDACGRQYPDSTLGSDLVNLDGAENNGCPAGTTLASFINPVPKHPTGGGQQGAYGYFKNPANGTPIVDFILRARLEGDNANALNNDLDGNPPTGWTGATLDCSDGPTNWYYCVGS